MRDPQQAIVALTRDKEGYTRDRGGGNIYDPGPASLSSDQGLHGRQDWRGCPCPPSQPLGGRHQGGGGYDEEATAETDPSERNEEAVFADGSRLWWNYGLNAWETDPE
jgi:hypothetical protein